MFYFFILSNSKPVVSDHTLQEAAIERRIQLNLIEYYGTWAYAENNRAEVISRGALTYRSDRDVQTRPLK